MRLFTVIILFIPVFSSAQIFSNDVISSNGDYGTSSTASLTWTVGEIAVTSYGSLTEGFHQCLACETTGFDENQDQHDLTSYPNPFVKDITISIPSNTGVLNLYIYDMIGNLVYSDQYTGNAPKEYSLHDLASGMYTLQVCSETEIIQTIKIQKQ
ncbi:MAG: T9SS type A sorting domain-containing protein [Crocinitomicaceae bacterium]|nr:T9SS type A sorting domain-containing protein [Crocinitomicaceae bacterium]